MSDWACPTCTFLNDEAAESCRMCGESRPANPGRTLGSGPGPDASETSILLPRSGSSASSSGSGSSPLRRREARRPPQRGGADWWSWVAPHLTSRNAVPLGVALLVLLSLSTTIVEVGHVGVVDVFGSVRATPLPAGLNFVNPLAKVHPVSVQTAIITAAENVPTKEGLSVHLEAAALFHLAPDRAPEMYRTVGMDALDRIVAANFHSVIREITSAHDAKALYTAKTRLEMTTDLKGNLQKLVASWGIIVEDTPLKKLELPESLQHAIEDKLLAEQAAEKMQFILDKERQEAERKKIEAGGISTFQQIVSGDVTEGILRWKGIEATEMLADSPNPKTVIIGGGDGGVPIIISDGDPTTSTSHSRGPSHSQTPRKPEAERPPAPKTATARTMSLQCAAGLKEFC